MFIKVLSKITSLFCDADDAVSPLYNAISTIGPYAMGVVGLLGVIYGIIMGVKYAKAEDSKERAALQKALVNGAVGFLSVLVLISLLYVLRGPITRYMDS